MIIYKHDWRYELTDVDYDSMNGVITFYVVSITRDEEDADDELIILGLELNAFALECYRNGEFE